MADTNTTIWVSIISASSAIMAVVVTQVITAINTRKSDERKEKAENRRSSLKKRIKIGENFYHMFSESSLNLNKLKTVFINERYVRSDGGLKNLTEQRSKIQERALQLVADTKLWNITDVYFNIESTSEKTNRDVVKMTDLQTLRIELDSQYSKSTEEEGVEIAKQFIKISDDIIELISTNIARVDRDLEIVKQELIRLTSLIER
jgi:propanediol dehydratase large subunit